MGFDGGCDWIGLGMVSGVLIVLGFVVVLGGGVGVGGNVVVVLMLMGMLNWMVGMVGVLG